jgi:hypothetical protein
MRFLFNSSVVKMPYITFVTRMTEYEVKSNPGFGQQSFLSMRRNGCFADNSIVNRFQSLSPFAQCRISFLF